MVRTFQEFAPEIGRNVYIDPAATVIGQVVLGDEVSLWPNVVLRGDVNRIEVGPGSNLQDGVIGHVTHDGPYTPGGHPLLIGADVTVGHAAVLHGCRIGARCLIGMAALVMDGAVLEQEVIVAAGSLVPPGKHLESGWLYRGRPVQPARRLSEDERAMLVYSAGHYRRLKDQYLARQQGGTGRP
ncbi:MAG: gamma carbonic anhydrase family protein [Wenzhouxiangellaceae bacterium]